MTVQKKPNVRDYAKVLAPWAPILVAAAVGAALLAGAVVGTPSSAHTARQNMALDNVGWSELAATHVRNIAWLDEYDTLDDVDLEIIANGDLQFARFEIIGEHSSKETLEAAVADAASALATSRGGYENTDAAERAVLEADLARLQALVDDLGEEAEQMRLELDALNAAGAPTAQIDTLDEEIDLVDDQRVQYSRQAIGVEDDLADLEVGTAADWGIEVIGEPVVENVTDPDLRLRTSLFAGVLALGLGAAAVVGWTRRYRPMRGLAGTRIAAEDRVVLDLSRSPQLDDAWIDVGALNRRMAGPTTVVPVTDSAGTQADALVEHLRRLVPAHPVVRSNSLDKNDEVSVPGHIVLVVEQAVTTGTQLRRALEKFSDYEDNDVTIAILGPVVAGSVAVVEPVS